MHKQIEKLKRDIAADNQSRAILEVQELAAQLDDLSRNLPYMTNPNVDPDMAVRSYWRALILARNAIEKSENNHLL